MRTFRSSVKTKRTAPLSSFFCPAPHFCAARTVKSSRVKPSGILRSTQTRSWSEVSRSNCSRRALSASAPPGPKTPARSVTYRCGFSGTSASYRSARAPADASATTSAARMTARERATGLACLLPPASRLRLLGRRRRGRRIVEVELHLRRVLGPRRRRLEIRLLLEAHETRDEVGREALQDGVVLLRGVVETPAR